MKTIKHTVIHRANVVWPDLTKTLAKSCLKIWNERYRWGYIKTHVELEAVEVDKIFENIPKEIRSSWINIVHPEWPEWLKTAILNYE